MNVGEGRMRLRRKKRILKEMLEVSADPVTPILFVAANSNNNTNNNDT